jgi:hypothetical protein
MKMTLLAMVQNILSSMSSDEVNAITDTTEAMQVADVIKTVYYEMDVYREWSYKSSLMLLDSVSDSSKPNYLRVPENVSTIKLIKYNRRKKDDPRRRMIEMKYLFPDEFLLKTENRDSEQENITVVTDFTGAKLNIKNDKAPEWYTSFDDVHVVLDSWDESVEITVQGGESQMQALASAPWSMDNNFTPKLSAKLFPGLLAEAKSICHYELKEEMNEKAEQQSVRQQRRMSLENWVLGKNVRYPNYGRTSAKAPSRRRPRVFGSRT